MQGVRISANAMQMLGVEAAAGRTLARDDDNPNTSRVVKRHSRNIAGLDQAILKQ